MSRMGYLAVILLLFLLSASSECSQRIIGSEETTIERRPYQASLQHINEFGIVHWCSGAIINTRFILTVAHCDPFISIPTFYARVGSTSHKEGGVTYKIGSFIPNPKFDLNTLDNDIAIASLNSGEEIILGLNVAIIPLRSGPDPAPDSWLTISGWGVTSSGSGTLSENLREADVPVMSDDECKMHYPFLTPRQLCVRGDLNIGSCGGDSGNPAVQDGKLVGLISGGNVCDYPELPGMYTKISAFQNWIICVTGVEF